MRLATKRWRPASTQGSAVHRGVRTQAHGVNKQRERGEKSVPRHKQPAADLRKGPECVLRELPTKGAEDELPAAGNGPRCRCAYYERCSRLYSASCRSKATRIAATPAGRG
eukprot:3748596-Rhodomonas_salina.3